MRARLRARLSVLVAKWRMRLGPPSSIRISPNDFLSYGPYGMVLARAWSLSSGLGIQQMNLRQEAQRASWWWGPFVAGEILRSEPPQFGHLGWPSEAKLL